MKYFVKVISVLILAYFVIEDLAIIFFSALCFPRLIESFHYGVLDIQSEMGFISYITVPATVIGMILIVLVILAFIFLSFLKIMNYYKSISRASYEYNWTLSLIGLIQAFANLVPGLVVYISFVLNVRSNREAFEMATLFVIGLNVFMAFWCILNLLSSRQCIVDEG